MAESYPSKFLEFWAAYPRKVAKIKAAAAWKKQSVEEDLYMAQAAIDDVLKRTRLKWWSKDPSKIPHPASWINAQRWHDEGWESEAEQGPRHRGKDRPMPQPPLPEHKVPWQEVVLGRLFRAYLLKAGGLPEVAGALAIKRELMDKFVPAYEQDIASGSMKPGEVALELASLFLSRLDIHYKLHIAPEIEAEVRRLAEQTDPYAVTVGV